MKNKIFFPIFVDLSKKKIVVIGAGTVAARRIETLINFTREILVVAPEINQKILDFNKRGLVKIIEKNYEASMLEHADMVLATTDNQELNQEIGRDCKERGILVNVASRKELCDFFFPGIVQKEEVVIGITASGKDHKKAKEIRERIEQHLDQWME